jgi:hypothetical protein
MFFLGATPRPLGDAYSRRFPIGVLVSNGCHIPSVVLIFDGLFIGQI